MEYIKATCEKMKWDEVRMINYAMANPDTFENSFKKWESTKYPEPVTSMDELAQVEENPM